MLNFDISTLDNEVIKCSYDLILKNIRNNKKLDISFLKEIVEMVKYFKKIEDYVSDIEVNNKLKDIATYSYYEKNIDFNLKLFANKCSTDKKLFSLEEFNIYIYLRCISLLLHELEHANQKKIRFNKEDLESIIINASIEKRCNLFNEWCELYMQKKGFIRRLILDEKMNHAKYIYNKYYDYAPEERIAYNRSLFLTMKLTELFENKYLLNHMSMFFYSSCLKCYDKTFNPTKIYISKINPDFNWNIVEELTKKVDFSKRVELGLQISKQEKEEVTSLLYSNVKDIIKYNNKCLVKKKK